ncbi:BEL1-like homeodomain protein 3 [Amaranthus tricolor]|uniref:BEL1-like homeodomain protein 3 n=1 Tax=Amaranthus tricolor TaxID=29722 RepID=UPI0025853166|nr:BEL1-like homeodomain protein 3 [Amaranthus tricolor]XP_057531856.1 BEL1-like homeodomain protein 3 [Amaranthus tricolor]XP_057531857.1 BEL1-like homeodomain protein 3 [Amaranthus tricolor]XP_057531858.1 BEL1-like homeodomain protein 3 [Amaranthus tricolor]
MATYYPSSSAQLDVMSAPYVRDQKFASYSESHLLNGNMMMYLTSSSSPGSFSEVSPGSSMNPQNGVEIPAINARNEMMFIPPTATGDSMCIQPISGPLNSVAGENVGNSMPGELQLTSRSQMNMVDGEQNLQGLSLSLSTQMSTAVSTSQFQYQYSNPGLSSVLSPHLPLSAENNVRHMGCKVDDASTNKDMRNSDYFPYEVQGEGHNSIRFGALNHSQYSVNPKSVNCNPYQYEQAGMANTLLKSKYMKVAQQLLDEVVNVRDALKRSDSGRDQNSNKEDESSKEAKVGSQAASESNEPPAGSGSAQELSPAERQELQSKLDKLHSMLDEVDRRYKQYCHQMQILVSSFDVVAGGGAAKPYTALALKTISRHFRCLRDAITGQIQATRKSLGEQDNGLGGAIPRLRYVDQQLRQQRALQQFGMMRHAWRPQRGLPESAVTILRAWLFEHFLHPYPKDSEKIMLARQTGLTRSQVANWFINARVRLWKPMVEEMYKEEFGEADILNSRSSPENTPKLTREKSWGSEDRREDMQESSTSIAHDSKINMNQGIGGLGSNDNNHGFYSNNASLSSPDPNHPHLIVSNAAYHIPELGNFSVDNQVSLALGLRHREGDVTFRGNPTTEATMGVGTSEYNPYLEQVNQQHRFGNPSHILNDFVA